MNSLVLCIWLKEVYMFQWFSKSEKNAIATIYSTNITINKPGVDILANSYAVMLGLDESNYKIALHPISQDDYESKKYPEENMFILSGGKSYVRVSSTDFVSKIGNLINHDFSKSTLKYKCYYDQKENLLIIDLRKEIK